MQIAISSILSAFSTTTIGTRVTNSERFMPVLRAAIETHDFSADRIPGQGFLMIPDAVPFVSAGVGPRSDDPERHVLRRHRGRVEALLQRKYAAPVEGCAAVVYTREAYLADPEVQSDIGEVARIQGADYVIVAVLAFAGPKPELSPHRLVSNLAGGNKEAAVWSADEIRSIARAVQAYDEAWEVVSD